MNPRAALLTLAHELADDAHEQFTEAERVRRATPSRPGPRRDPARHIEAAAFSYHSQALGVLKAIDILDREGQPKAGSDRA